MAVARKRTKMRRLQISLSEEQFQSAKRLAQERGVSMSQILREALTNLAPRSKEEEDAYWNRVLSIIGTVEGADPRGSERIDEVLYGPSVR